MHKIFDKILDIIYPPVCGICGKGKNTYLCKKCENKLYLMALFGTDIYKDKYFKAHFYIFKYKGIIRNLILNYKFYEKTYLYKSFADFFIKYQKNFLYFNFYDIIVPVPISKERKKTRGYNQSLLIAKELAKKFHIDLKENILIKQKNNVKQSTLNQYDRTQNVINAYKISKKEELTNKKILLIDDVYTTGATVNECSKILSLAGTKRVDVFTIAKD